MIENSLRLAHISDLHFGKVVFHPLQFFSKRWIGNINFALKRKKDFIHTRLYDLIPFFKEEKVTHLIISGDFSITSQSAEFQLAQNYLRQLQEAGLKIYAIPGNHDHYTKQAYKKKLFYNFFPEKYTEECPYNLKDHQITYTELIPHLWLVALDTAVATSLISSQGFFSPKAEENLEKALQQIPKEDKIILLNHFPFFQNDVPSKQLVRGSLLRNLIQKFPNIQIYLHGHTHRQIVADLRESQLPMVLDTGSTPHLQDGGCHILDIHPKEVFLSVFRYGKNWEKQKTHSFNW